MTFSIALNFFVLIANAVTVGLLFYSTLQQKRAYREQDKVNIVQHARITNLERQVLTNMEDDTGAGNHHVH